MSNIQESQIVILLGDFIPDYTNKAGIFLCTSGSAEVLIGENIFHMEPHMVYLITPLVVVHIISRSDDFAGLHMLDDIEVFYPIVHLNFDSLLPLEIYKNPCLKLTAEDEALLMDRQHHVSAKIEQLQRTSRPEEINLIQQMIHLLKQETLLEVVDMYFRNQSVELRRVDGIDSVVYKFIYSIHRHVSEHRPVSYYADEACLSAGYFTSVVRKRTGRTPSQWINMMTTAQAKNLLERTQKSIKEIAQELSFPEQFTFRKYFKQNTGISPKEWRRRYCKNTESSKQ